MIGDSSSNLQILCKRTNQLPKELHNPGPCYYNKERSEKLTKVRPQSCNFDRQKRHISQNKPETQTQSELGPGKYQTQSTFGADNMNRGRSFSPKKEKVAPKIDERDYDIERGIRATKVRTIGYTFSDNPFQSEGSVNRSSKSPTRVRYERPKPNSQFR